jgi:hypothetical protein
MLPPLIGEFDLVAVAIPYLRHHFPLTFRSPTSRVSFRPFLSLFSLQPLAYSLLSHSSFRIPHSSFF